MSVRIRYVCIMKDDYKVVLSHVSKEGESQVILDTEVIQGLSIQDLTHINYGSVVELSVQVSPDQVAEGYPTPEDCTPSPVATKEE